MDGWPFLVARGRRSGYGVLLTPEFLLSRHGVLEEIAGSGPRVVSTAVDGRPLTVVWSEHVVTSSDLGTDETPRDEHSRPLHLLYGFACPETGVGEVSEADLRDALRAALATYRRFLDDEEAFGIETSAPLPLRSAVTRRATPRPPRRIVPAALAGLVAVTAVVIIAMSSSPEERPGPPPPCTPSTTTTTSQPM